MSSLIIKESFIQLIWSQI